MAKSGINKRVLSRYGGEARDGISLPSTIWNRWALASEHKELLTGILRDEWGFDGLVTTDWWTFGEHYRETKAGNDIKMAAGYPERVKEAYENGFISEEEIRLSARRILSVILRID